jgi:hypothetical protein
MAMAVEKHIITLTSGFAFDFTNLFGPDRLSAEDIAGMADKIAAAQKAISHLRKRRSKGTLVQGWYTGARIFYHGCLYSRGTS